MGNTLAFRSEEGRGYRRYASGSWRQATIRRSPNEETLILLIESINKKEPFPHGTISLSVIQEYLALRGGPRRLKP